MMLQPMLLLTQMTLKLEMQRWMVVCLCKFYNEISSSATFLFSKSEIRTIVLSPANSQTCGVRWIL